RLVGMNFKYRWYPLGYGVRQSLTVAGELLHDVGDADPLNGGPRRDVLGNPVRQGAWGGYVYAEYRLSKQWRPGVRFDYFQLQSEPLLVESIHWHACVHAQRDRPSNGQPHVDGVLDVVPQRIPATASAVQPLRSRECSGCQRVLPPMDRVPRQPLAWVFRTGINRSQCEK